MIKLALIQKLILIVIKMIAHLANKIVIPFANQISIVNHLE